MMQFYYTMQPVFQRLGVNLIVRNLAQSGGTLKSALGSKDLLGEEIDVMVWDDKDDYELFARQALLGNRVPFLYNGPFQRLMEMHNKGADILYMGDGSLGIPVTEDEEQVNSLPWAVRYMKCNDEDLCRENKYRTQCWVDRDDVIPPTKQNDHVHSQVNL